MSINREMKKRFFACDVDADNIYISTYEGMLFFGNKKTMEMSIVRCEKGRELLHSSPAERMAVCGRYIYMFGCDYRKVNVFDMTEKSCSVLLDYQSDPNMSRSIGGYFAIVKNDEKIYVFVDSQRGFYKICNGRCEFKEFDILTGKYKWNIDNVLGIFDYDSNNGYFYFNDCGKVLCFESNTECWREYEIHGKIESPVSIQNDADYLYILTRNNRYYKYGMIDNSFEEVPLPISLKEKDWDHLMVVNKKGILLPGANEEIVEIQICQEGTDICFQDYPTDMESILIDEYKPLYHKFRDFCEDEIFRYYSARYYNYMLKINKKTGELIWEVIVWPNEQRFIEGQIYLGKVIQEGDYDFQNWLNVVMEA